MFLILKRHIEHQNEQSILVDVEELDLLVQCHDMITRLNLSQYIKVQSLKFKGFINTSIQI